MLSDPQFPGPEQFRDYLVILARSLWEPELQARLDPSDLVQQTLAEALKSLQKGQFNGTTEAEMAGWLRTMLSRNLANAIRDNTRAKRDLARERSIDASLEESSARLYGWLADSGAAPSEHATRLERLDLLANALARLPKDQGVAVTLRHIRELSLAEIADKLKRTETSVAGLIRRGLITLRQLMSGQE